MKTGGCTHFHFYRVGGAIVFVSFDTIYDVLGLLKVIAGEGPRGGKCCNSLHMVSDTPRIMTVITARTMNQKNIPKMHQRITVPVGLSSNSFPLE